MDTKNLKSLRESISKIENNSENLSSSILDYAQSLQEWMVNQHNCAIRTIAPFIYDINLEYAQKIAAIQKQMCEKTENIVKGLIEDELIVEECRKKVNELTGNGYHCPVNNSQNEIKLNKASLKMNTEFMYKEIKKIIRFKYGYCDTIDAELAALTERQKALQTQKNMIKLIPEAYDIDTLRQARVDVSRSAMELHKSYKKGSSHHKDSASSKPKTLNDSISSTDDVSDLSLYQEDNIKQEERHTYPSYLGKPSSDFFHNTCNCCGYLCKSDIYGTLNNESTDATTLCEFDQSDGCKFYLNELTKKCCVSTNRNYDSVSKTYTESPVNGT